MYTVNSLIMNRISVAALVTLSLVSLAPYWATLRAQTPMARAPQPDKTPAAPIPPIAGLKVLFGGKSDDITVNWQQKGQAGKWDCEDGAMIASRPDSISTKEKFTDFQLHVEFREPYLPDAKGQARGNSGVFLQGRYEIQVLDSYGISDPGSGDCGAVYSIHAPLVNACKPPLQWQTYDIVYRAPRIDPATHALIDLPRVTVLQNGILVQNQVAITRSTHQPKLKASESAPPPALPTGYDTPGPITLQWHGSRVAFRNIWVVPLALNGANHY
jgi:hypothetical protein